MPGTYFVPRLLVALIVPLTLASLGPAESHPELGTDVGSLQKRNNQVYRANDVPSQVALADAQKPREVTKIQAFRRGQRVHLRRKEE